MMTSRSSQLPHRFARHAVLVFVALCMMLPFVWMVLASLKTLGDIDRNQLLGSPWHAENYANVFRDPDVARKVSFARYYFNSLFVAAWVTFLTCLTSAMAAFAFARLRWRGRDLVFLLYLATLMVPGVVTMIPNYALMVKLHLLDSYTGLIVPASFSAFGTFLLRQFMLTIPSSLDEAAAIDGATPWQVFWEVVLPLARPGLITLGIFAFLGNYGSFFWPLVLIKSQHLRTLPVGMLYFDTIYGRQTNLIMAASVMAVVPPVILFLVSQKFLVRGIQLGAVKG
jgi:ABC-type glycerol-3-phosphate transport system permease component